jgi:hypothetical protein
MRELSSARELAMWLRHGPGALTPRKPAAAPPAADVLARWREQLPAGQFAAVAALVAGGVVRSLDEAAAALGVSRNTVATHLRRIRRERPAIYSEVVAVRRAHLARRHEAAMKRAEAHSRAWHRRQFYRTWGHWPRERRRGG